MKTCVKCGKKGIFLWLSKQGHCEQCAAETRIVQKATEYPYITSKTPRSSNNPTQTTIDYPYIKNKTQFSNDAPKAFAAPKPTVATSEYQIKAPHAIGECRAKYKYSNVPVAGIQHAQPDFSTLEVGGKIDLVHEPDNEYDKKAVRVEFNGQKLGYIIKESQHQSMILDFQRRGDPIYAAIWGYDKEQSRIYLYIAYYKNLMEGLENCESAIATLTKTSKKDDFDSRRDENLLLNTNGDPLQLEYNDETETYWVRDDVGNEIGELSKSISAKMMTKESNSELIAFLEEITESDEGKYGARIRVYFK
ncbi:MAG: HIRAN domain-containing protein [Bacillota bacterium]